MGKARIKECSKCNCDRKILVRADILQQGKEGFFGQFSTKWLCIPCFLKLLKPEIPLAKSLNSHYYACTDFDEKEIKNNG